MESQELCQILDVEMFNDWVLENASSRAFMDSFCQCGGIEWDDEDFDIDFQITSHEFSRFIYLNDKNHIFILFDDIIKLVEGLANEISYKKLSQMERDGKIKLCWDSEAEDFVWLKL